MSARRAEIEAKRAKLAELRRAREERARRMQASRDESATSTGPEATAPSVDELVATLLRPTSSMTVSDTSEVAAPEKKETQTEPGPSGSSPPPPSMDQHHHVVEAPPAPQPDKIIYTKEVQTDPLDEPASVPPNAVPSEPLPSQDDMDHAPLSAPPEDTVEPTPVPVTSDFTDFVHTKAMVMERMLDEQYDVLTDYTHIPTEADEAEAAAAASLRHVHTFMDESLFDTRAVTDIDWSAKHPELVAVAYNRKRVLAHDDDHQGLVAVWNLHVRERPEFVFTAPTDVVSVLASPYHPNLFIGGTYSGQVLLWDTRHRGLPVQRTPLAFRSGEPLAHSAPVYSLRMTGHAQAPQLVSASTDGVVCTWSLDMLARPQETLLLSNPWHPRSAEVGITCLDTAPNDASRFLVGTEEGNIVAAQRYDRAGVAAGLDLSRIYVGHSAPVTRLECHPLPAATEPVPASMTDLFLTTSMDWTTALWRATPPLPRPTASTPSTYTYPHANPRIASQRAPTRTSAGTTTPMPTWTPIAPLLRFENQHDYVMDARWHPQHPAVFAQVDAGGHVDVYHLTQNMERPILSAVTPGQRGLNRVAWEKRGDGAEPGSHVATRLAVGGVDARVHIYEVADAIVTSRGDVEWIEMEQALTAAATSAAAGMPASGAA